ncbi:MULTISPECIES: DedA family protein [Anaeromyxobacter]|uniref:DedA family protein n=1 Tax=Anaeromyxobacter TaxID=161492 RepID=UPI001F5A9FCC|nr:MULTISPECIES: DedA family protein [unclassified Anaeromyxobacter]
MSPPVESPADFLARWQYTGLFAVIFVEEAGVPLPLPGDLFIAAMGFLAHGGRAAFAPTAAVVTTATVLGAALLYLVSRHAGRPLLVRLARRLGYTEEREARLEAWLTRRGAPAVVLGRLVPGLRIVMTVVAGALRLRQSTFALGTLVAGLVWATLYFWIGWALGAGYERVGGGGALASAWPAAVAIAIAASLALTWRVRARRAPRAEP